MIEDESFFIVLFNCYGSFLFFMYFYKLIELFLNEFLEIVNNFLMSCKDGNYYFLLFNKINDCYLFDS